MAQVLINLYRGLDAWRHLYGRSMHGGAGQTERALKARGWVKLVDGELTLTDHGRERAADFI